MNSPRIFFKEKDARVKMARAGGPGGQNVNKRATKVQVWLPVARVSASAEEKKRIREKLASRITQADEIEIECDEERSQEANRARAFTRLHELLRVAVKIRKKRIPTKISVSAETRFQEQKKKQAEKKKMRKFLPKEWLE
jgi:ribosome-associated protein